MVNADQLIKLLDFNLANKSFENAVKLIDDEEHGKVILSHYPEVIQQVILKHLNTKNYANEPALYEVCEAIMKLLAEKCHQEGILFEFLEIIETVKDDDVFTSVLKCLQVIVLNQSEKKSRSLEYCLNSIEEYVLALPLPSELLKNVEEEEEKVLENDDQIRRVLMMYITLDLFYGPIVKQIVDTSPANKIFRSNKFNRRNVLFCFVLRLLGQPLSFLDLSYHEDTNKVVTYSRQVAETMISTMCKLHIDVFQLLKYVELRSRWPSKDKLDDDLDDIFLHHEKTPMIQLGMLFYLVIAEGLSSECIPKVYNPVYVFQMGIYLVNAMMTADASITFKGLKLCLKMLDNIGSTLCCDELDLEIHRTFCNSLVKLLVYSPSTRNRRNGIIVLKTYIQKFDTHGQYLLIKNILRISNHKGLMGYLTTLYKDLIFDDLKSGKMSVYTSGSCLKHLIMEHMCKLTEGAQCDIADSSDQIVASLNFVYALLRSDTKNLSGIRDFLPDLQTEFLDVLRAALDLSRAHYYAEIENVKAGKSKNLDEILKGTGVMFDTEPLANLTSDKKLQMLFSALSTFDLIDYHLANCNDVINRAI